MRRLLVPVAVLLFALPLAAGRQRPSIAIPLTTEHIEEALGEQRAPAIASDGESFFAVWLDSRGASHPDIYGARITARGEVIDRFGILVAKGENEWLSPPDVTWSGSEYVVFWGSSGDVFSASVSREGRLVRSPESIFHPYTTGTLPRAVTAHGLTLLLVGNTVSRIGEDGKGMYGPVFGSVQALVPTPDGFVVFNSSSRGDLYASLLDLNGKLLTSRLALHNFSGHGMSAANVSDRILAAWSDGLDSISVGAFDASGTSLTAALHIPNANDAEVVALDGEFVVTWTEAVDVSSDGIDVYSLRFNADGSQLDSVPITLSRLPEIGARATAAGSSNAVMVYDTGADARQGAIRGLTFPNAVSFEVTATPTMQCGVDAASGVDTTLIAWSEVGSTTHSVRAALMRNDGTVVDRDALEIGVASSPQHVSVAAAPNEFVVAWPDPEGIVAQRVDRSGATEDSPTVLDRADKIAMLFDRESYVLAYTDWEGLITRRLGLDGGLTERSVLLRWDDYAFSSVAIDRLSLASDDDSFVLLISFSHPGCHIPECPPVTPPAVEIDRLDSNLAGRVPVAHWEVPSTNPDATFAAIDGVDLVVWSANDGLRGRRFDSAWRPIDAEQGFLISGGVTRDARIVARDGGWLITFSEDTDMTTTLREAFVSSEGAVTQLPVIASVAFDGASGLPGPATVPIAIQNGRVVGVYDATDERSSIRRLFVRSLRAWRARLVR